MGFSKEGGARAPERQEIVLCGVGAQLLVSFKMAGPGQSVIAGLSSVLISSYFVHTVPLVRAPDILFPTLKSRWSAIHIQNVWYILFKNLQVLRERLIIRFESANGSCWILCGAF
jgi:hypothetical protein